MWDFTNRFRPLKLILPFLPILISISSASWWLSDLATRVSYTEERIQHVELKLDGLLTILDSSKKELYSHYFEDVAFQVQMKEKVETLVHEIRRLHRELRLPPTH